MTSKKLFQEQKKKSFNRGKYLIGKIHFLTKTEKNSNIKMPAVKFQHKPNFQTVP